METRNSRFLSAVNSNSRTSSNDEISAIIILREFAEAKRGAPSILGIHLLPGEKFPVHPFLDSNFRSWKVIFSFSIFLSNFEQETIISHEILFAPSVTWRKRKSWREIWKKKKNIASLIGYNYHFFVLYVHTVVINKVYLTRFENFEIMYI